MKTFLTVVLLSTLAAAAQAVEPDAARWQAKAETLQLASRPEWRRLLQYRRNLFGRFRSEIDDPSFFLSARGQTDPRAELNATLAAFFAPAIEETETVQHARCRYPARFEWLQTQLGFHDSDWPAGGIVCGRFDKWRAQMAPASATLIFASAYLNNPASMYGHTFVRLNRPDQNPLLAYAVNYAATIDTQNGLVFAVKGLFGGFRGRFSTVPYYMKVQEYSNLESRDLWEYELAASSESLRRMVQHLWEIGPAESPYFFLNKNCSYYLLPWLESADLKLDLRSPFLFKAIPVDTLRHTVSQIGLASAPRRRLSHTARLMAARQALSTEEIQEVEQLAKNPFDDAGLAPFAATRQALILDSAHDLLRYRAGFKRVQPLTVQKNEAELLRRRSAFPEATRGLSRVESSAQTSVSAPESGHPTGRVGLSYGVSNRSHFEELSLRPAIHDLDDRPEGYLPWSQLEMFSVKLRYDQDLKSLYVQQFSLVDLVSLSPWDRWVHPLSWRVQTGVRIAQDLPKDPDHALYYGGSIGSGYALALGTDRALLFGMADLDLGLGAPFQYDHRMGGGGTAGLLLRLSKKSRVRVQASQWQYVLGQTGGLTHLLAVPSFSLSDRWELRATFDRQNHYKEMLFGLYLYL